VEVTPRTGTHTATSDRWVRVNERLFAHLAPAAANRWWVTPLAKLGGVTPIEAWEAGGQVRVERIVADYARETFW
jgi:hypothetical protein